MIETKIVPPIRQDIMFEKANVDQNELLLLSDPYGFAKESLSISSEFLMFLSSIGDNFTFGDIKQEVNNDEIYSLIVDSINVLDEAGYLISESLFAKIDEAREEYNSAPMRPMITAGNSYPEAKELFEAFFNFNFVSEDLPNSSSGKLKGLILPHIDFAIGSQTIDVYKKGLTELRSSDADLFIIFGTSHRFSTDFFMLSEKPYDTPLGVVETDSELLEILKNKLEDGITIDDFAHKFEHSIEYQAVLLKALFKERDIKILPILVGTSFDYLNEGITPIDEPRVANFINALNETIAELGRKPMFVASVDLAHIGRKFADEFDAETVFDELKLEDAKLIELIESGDKDQFFAKIAQDCDKWKICGTSPIYALLATIGESKGKLIGYDIWDEQATKSAVSFASIAMY